MRMTLQSFLVLTLGLFALQSHFSAAILFQAGKVNISDTSQNNHGCQSVSFKVPFQGSSDVKVIATLSHGNAFIKIHDPAALWVKSVSTRGFDVCVREAGSGSGGKSIVNWLALQGSHQGVNSGIVQFNEWTSRTQCQHVRIRNAFKNKPQILVTVQHKHSNRPFDSMNVWLEDVKTDGFRVCLREFMTFDGIHSNLKVHWLAYDELPSSLNFTGKGQVRFSGNGAPKQANNYAFCQDVNFVNPFYKAPVVLVSAGHDNISQSSSLWDKSDGCEYNALTVWIEEITQSSFKVCVKDLQGTSKNHEPITIEYAVIGDLDPCINVSCEYFAICKAFDAFDARCVCEESCPSYEEPVCSSNSTTFKNKCTFELEMCRLKSNHTLYHPGSCTGFPVRRGRMSMKREASLAETACEKVVFPPFSFYPDKDVHVQITINHWNSTRKHFIHDASVSWVESVNYDNFKVCVTTAGRNDRATEEFATVDWMAYQGAPDGGVAGKTRFPQWWTGSHCKEIPLPKGKFTKTPTVLATAEHISSAYKHDAASLWIENATQSSFKICLRELQNYDGIHEDIFVGWMAFDDIHRPLFSERRKVEFPNNNSLSKNFNGAFCKDVNFSRFYDHEPTVITAVNHSSAGKSLMPKYMSVTPWIEHIKLSGFRVCLKELFADQHDPVTVSYVVLSDICKPGWSYFSGVCYFTSQSCKNWTEAQKTCESDNSSLITIRNQEENVYVQHRLNGEKGWIGLNDRASEGTFIWADSRPSRNFTYWANHQPNNYKLDEDCVHTLGVRHSFQWNDVSCGACHNYTCSQDLDECKQSRHKCHTNGVCTNTYGSYTCHCAQGYTGDGQNCSDIDECSTLHTCDSSASCNNTDGSYNCTCNSGYTGDGRTCRDVDECASNTDNCDVNALCTNIPGSFTCKCKDHVYFGNGVTCSAVRGLQDSLILNNDTSKTKQLNYWLSSRLQDSSKSYWKRCYRATSDGWYSRTFHRNCDSKGPTVTIIRAQGYIFGGYVDKSWQWSSGTYVYSSRAFIYSLKNPGYGYFKKYVSSYSYAIYSNYNYGPTFGSGFDIYVCNYASSNWNSYFTNSYSYTGAYSSYYVWAGSSSFNPDELEVYYEKIA